MKRASVALGILGLVWGATMPAFAQKQYKLFGKTYNVTQHKRAETYKNGKRVTLTDNGNRHAYCYFEEGAAADGSQDNLWFVCRITINDDDDGTAPNGHQWYTLTGTDANGQFTPAASNMTDFFGGSVTRIIARRPTTMILLNRENKGKKVDRNIMAETFWDDDGMRIFDLDTMNDGDTDPVFKRVNGQGAPSVGDLGDREGDPNLPLASFPSWAHTPTVDGKTVLAFGGQGGVIQMGLWDTSKDDAYNALTDVGEITANSTKKFPTADSEGNGVTAHCIARYSGSGNEGEYLMLVSNPSIGGDGEGPRTTNTMVRAKITVPANPAAATPGSLKVEVLDTQELINDGKDVIYSTEDNSGGDGLSVISVAVGREVAPGLRRLYLTDFSGYYYTLTPVP